jgi:lipopolysaccharide export system protein LptA
MKKVLFGVALYALACGASYAERADALKQIKVLANTGVANMVNQGGVAEGNVVLTRGTLIMKAGKLTLAEDPEGYKFVTLLAAPGELATFRQKRDGGADLWVEGEAERIDYDDKTDQVKLSGKAKVKSLDGARVTNGAEGPFISYDSRKEVFTALNTPSGQGKAGAGRVEFIFDQKPHSAPAAPAPGKQ